MEEGRDHYLEEASGDEIWAPRVAFGVRVSWGPWGETNREPALSEWREEEEGGRGAASRV